MFKNMSRLVDRCFIYFDINCWTGSRLEVEDVRAANGSRSMLIQSSLLILCRMEVDPDVYTDSDEYF